MSRSLATSLALSAAALFLSACGKEQPPTTTPGAAESAGSADGSAAGADGDGSDVAAVEVKCLGINECSGESACDVAGSHDCGGQNSCKGKGWIVVPQSECDAKGGEILASDDEEAEAEEAVAEEAAAEEPA